VSCCSFCKPAVPPASSPASHPARLWLCLYLDDLPLAVLPGRDDHPRAILTGPGAGKHEKSCVLACNDAAAALGIRPGHTANAALALVPGLDIGVRDGLREKRALEKLAAWSIRFTPFVSIVPPHALLLEVGASLRLFGGPERLRADIAARVRRLGYRAQLAGGPTALAALWLARAGSSEVIERIDQLPGRLAGLPLSCLGWPQRILRRFARAGVGMLGECTRLPRDGFARRFGADRLLELDRGFGRQPEVVVSHVFPRCFEDHLELPLETAGVEQLAGALEISLKRLGDELRRHQAGVEVLWIRLFHLARPVTCVRVGLLRPVMDPGYLLEMTRIKLAGLQLDAAVVSIGLRAGLVPAATDTRRDLFGRRLNSGEDLAALLERLRARLGDRAVHGLCAYADHRPELAWRAVSEPGGDRYAPGMAGAGCRRPLWMLEKPVPLKVMGGRPVYRGKLSLQKGPERIETGWWDGRDIRRDYYVAGHRAGMCFWIFRDCRNARWYLHGMFG